MSSSRLARAGPLFVASSSTSAFHLEPGFLDRRSYYSVPVGLNDQSVDLFEEPWRRFAVSIILNDDFDGGEVSFPEYGSRGFKPPPGGAVVFSCSLLHAVSRVTRGLRFAFLPFLYDDEAAKIREANNQFLGEGVGAYNP